MLKDTDNARRTLYFRSNMRRSGRTKKKSAPEEKSNISQAIVTEAAREFDYSPTFTTPF